MSYEIVKYVGLGLLALGAAGAAFALVYWVCRRLKSFADKWWEEQKRRFKNGERVALYVNLRDLKNQIMRGVDRIHIVLTGQKFHVSNPVITTSPVVLPPIDTDVDCDQKTAKRLLEDQQAERKPISVCYA